VIGAAIGQILPLAVGVALSPVPIIAVALMLMSQRARLNGPVFVIGWLIGLAVIGVVVLAVAGPGDASSHGKPATWVSALKLVLGLLLLLVAVRQWHGRPRPGHEVEAPKWMGSIERFSPGAQRGHYGCYLPDHRGQADRRRHRRLQQLTISAGTPRS
jgi:peptidoglycan/LPS O-acetylase OafA/YrhL